MDEKITFRIDYLGADGTAKKMDIAAINEEEAIRLSGLPRGRIEAVRKDWLTALKRKLTEAPVPLETQSTLLSNFASMLVSGSPPGVAFNTVLKRDSVLSKRAADVETVSLVSAKLKMLKFDPQIVLMAEIGEAAGELGDSLSRAADDLIERKKMQGEFKKALTVPILMLVVGLGSMIATPMFAKKPLESVTAIRGMKFEPNFLTDMMFGIYWATTTLWWGVLAAIAALVIYRRPIWRAIRDLPGFRIINETLKVQRSLIFLISLRPLLRASVPVSQAVRQIRDSSAGETRACLDRVFDHFKTGGALSTSFRSEDWAQLMIDGLSGFDNVLHANRDKVLDRLISLHRERVKTTNGKLIAFITSFGTIMGLLSIAMIFGGMTFPLMNTTPTGRM